MATIAENLDRIVDAKEAIRGAIIDKGVQVPSDAKIDEYSTLIGQIEGGGGEDTLKQYLDGTLVKDGVLDLRNYTELPSHFLVNEKYNYKVKQILWNDNTKTIPYEFMNNNSLEVFTLPKNIEHISCDAITNGEAHVQTFVFPNSLIDIGNAYVTINLNVGSGSAMRLYFYNLTFGENVKYIDMELVTNISDPQMTFLSTLAPQIGTNYFYIDNLVINIHCWGSGYSGGFWDKVLQRGGSFKYIEQLVGVQAKSELVKVNFTETVDFDTIVTYNDGEEKTIEVPYPNVVICPSNVPAEFKYDAETAQSQLVNYNCANIPTDYINYNYVLVVDVPTAGTYSLNNAYTIGKYKDFYVDGEHLDRYFTLVNGRYYDAGRHVIIFDGLSDYSQLDPSMYLENDSWTKTIYINHPHISDSGSIKCNTFFVGDKVSTDEMIFQNWGRSRGADVVYDYRNFIDGGNSLNYPQNTKKTNVYVMNITADKLGETNKWGNKYGTLHVSQEVYDEAIQQNPEWETDGKLGTYRPVTDWTPLEISRRENITDSITVGWNVLSKDITATIKEVYVYSDGSEYTTTKTYDNVYIDWSFMGENEGEEQREFNVEGVEIEGRTYDFHIIQKGRVVVQYTVEKPHDVTYGFEYVEGENYWKSTNENDDSSFSYAIVRFSNNTEPTTMHYYIDSEANCDYALISKPNVELDKNNDPLLDKVWFTIGSNSGDMKKWTDILLEPADFYTIVYRKDSSVTQGEDCFKFRICD